jgi:sacsin
MRLFGQVERLTSRLRQLIHDYPEGLGIIKELLQNADDAGARVLRPTFDWRNLLPGKAECCPIK